MKNSYLIMGYLILANKIGTASPQNGMQRYKGYATAMQKKSEQFNDFSNTVFTTRVIKVVRRTVFQFFMNDLQLFVIFIYYLTYWSKPIHINCQN